MAGIVPGMRRVVALAALAALSAPVACTNELPRFDAGAVADAGPPPVDAGPLCGCTPGIHTTTIVVAGDDGSLWTFDPFGPSFDFVVGPACAEVLDPYSLAVDPKGLAWLLSASTRRIFRFDVNEPGACEDSGYLPTVPELPLFGMSFVSDGTAAECSTLYGMSYSGDGPFREGEGLGRLARIEGDPPRATLLAPTDFDGGELAGTGDGRLFAFAGERPPQLLEYDPATGALLDARQLPGLFRGNASAFAFFGGDLFLFTEAPPLACEACFEASCAEAYAACEGNVVCREQLACAIEAGRVRDDCGGGVGAEMLACLESCAEDCLTSSRGRVSQVVRVDWDGSDGGGFEVVVPQAPLRVVGAASSPCVPVLPF
jgi:hypothetical protein